MEEMLLLPDAADSTAMRELLAGVRLTQELSDHLVVVDGDPGRIAEILAGKGVRSALSLEMAEFDGLTGAERLAVDAWRIRNTILDKERPFEGRSWGKPPG